MKKRYTIPTTALSLLAASCASADITTNPNIDPPRINPDPYLVNIEQDQRFAGTKPNVVLIFVDDMGYGDPSCYGNTAYNTPNLDKMAEEGLRAERFYVAQPVCGASRAALLTGTYANRIGMSGAPDYTARYGINANEWLMPEMFKDAGYVTSMAGKWHLGHFKEFMPKQHGFDTFTGIPYSNDMWPLMPVKKNYPDLPTYYEDEVIGYNTDQSQFTKDFTDFTINFIKENKDKPFFSYVTYPMPHTPIFVSDKFKDKSGAGLYGDVIQEIDWGVGEILKTLKELGIDDKTMVIFSSDNGPWRVFGNHAGSTGGLRQDKGSIYEGGVRVPMIARMPGTIPAGQVYQGNAMTIDFMPTFAKMIGARLPVWGVDGKEMFAQLFDKDQSSVQKAYHFYYYQNDLQATLVDNYKLIDRHVTRMTAVEANDGVHGKYAFPWHPKALFNLATDYTESTCLLKSAKKDPELSAILKELNEEADKARADLGDQIGKRRKGKNRRPHANITVDTNGKTLTLDTHDTFYTQFAQAGL